MNDKSDQACSGGPIVNLSSEDRGMFLVSRVRACHRMKLLQEARWQTLNEYHPMERNVCTADSLSDARKGTCGKRFEIWGGLQEKP
jgi:hypothetical protein